MVFPRRCPVCDDSVRQNRNILWNRDADAAENSLWVKDRSFVQIVSGAGMSMTMVMHSMITRV